MNVHAYAKLGPAGRRALMDAIGEGESLREAASRFGVSPASVACCPRTLVAASGRRNVEPRDCNRPTTCNRFQ